MTLLDDILNDDSEIRQTALKQLADAQAIGALIPALLEEIEYGGHKVRMRALHALAWLKDERLIEPLLEFTKQERLRPGALRALGRYPEVDDVMTALEKALKDPSQVVRESAIQALGDTRSWKAFGPLQRFIQDNRKREDPLNLVPMAIRTLGALGDRRAVEPLERLLIDAEYEMREAIEDALRALHNE